MGAHRPAKTGPMRVVESGLVFGRTVSGVVVAAIVATMVLSAPAVAENIPLPVPAPLPKTGSAPPAAASTKSETPGLFPFSALFGNKSSGGGLFSSPSAHEPASPFDAKQRAILDRVSGYLSSVQTMVGKFVQVGPDGGRTEGTFYIQKPGRVRFAYNPPSPIDIIADGSSVVVRDRKLATQDLYPLSQTQLRYLLAERIDLLRDTDVVSVTADESYLTVVIEQKQILVGTDRLMIMFDAKDMTLKQWTVTDPQGFDTTVAVFNLDSTKKPDPNLFVINYQRDQQGVQ